MGLDRLALNKFKDWFEAASLSGEVLPESMNLATCSKEGRPSSRVVLLKDFGENGFTFFTNYQGQKSRELAENPFAALCFHWKIIKRQVRIEGRVEKTSRQVSSDYFKSRPFASQVAASLSRQSSRLPSYEALYKTFLAETQEKNPIKPLDCPDNWGGFRLIDRKSVV